jgi:putative (di)nucleoside polyphosphate hydrolase
MIYIRYRRGRSAGGQSPAQDSRLVRKGKSAFADLRLLMPCVKWIHFLTEWRLGSQVIDSDGYRLNVGIILTNPEGKLLWARRIRQDAWQFPQGGIRSRETPEQAMYRELAEEVGLQPQHVDVLGATRGWLRYRLPERFIRRHQKPVCIGQKQVWYMLRLIGEERFVRLDLSEKPEFDHWRWVDYWQPLEEVVSFKRSVYKKALNELAPLVFPNG